MNYVRATFSLTDIVLYPECNLVQHVAKHNDFVSDAAFVLCSDKWILPANTHHLL